MRRSLIFSFPLFLIIKDLRNDSSTIKELGKMKQVMIPKTSPNYDNFIVERINENTVGGKYV